MSEGVAEQVEQAYAEAMLRAASQFLAGLAPQLSALEDTLGADIMCSLLALPSEETGDDQAALMGFQQIVARVVVSVSAVPSTEGVAFLRAADAYVPPDLRDVVETAVAGAVARGIQEPAWAHRGPLEVGPCWRWSGGDGEVVSVAFAGGPPHVLAAHVDRTTQGIYDIDAYEDVDDARADQAEAFAPAGMTEESLTVAEAAAALTQALAVPIDRREAGDDKLHQAVALRQLLRARVAAM